MGRFKIIFRLLVACFVCAAVIWLLDRPAMQTISRGNISGKLFKSSLGEVNYVMLEHHDGRQVELQRDFQGWRMSKPNVTRAIDSTVMELLDAFEQAPLLEYIDKEDLQLRELGPNDFGLTHPYGRLVIRGPRFRTELKAGDCDAVTNGFFVAFDSLEGICVTDPALRGFFAKDPTDFIDRRMLHTKMRQVSSIVIRRPALGDIKLVRDGKTRWLITQPLAVRADWDAVDEFFETLSSAEAVAIPQESEDYGFDRPDAVSIRLFGENDLVGQTLAFGYDIPEKDCVYVRNPEKVSLVVTGSIARIATRDVFDFCDKRLFPSATPLDSTSISVTSGDSSFSLSRSDDKDWNVTAPVTELADPECAARLTDAILSLAATRIMAADDLDAASRSASVSIGSKRGTSRFDVFVSRSEADGTTTCSIVPDKSTVAYVVPFEVISNITQYCANPLPLVSRTVLAMAEGDISAITITRDGKEQERIECSSGKWASTSALQQIDSAAVARFLATVSSLEGKRVASLVPSPDCPVDGGVEIAFDLSDGTSLRRILKIGPRTDDGHYASVKGRDSVFLISHEDAANLLHPLAVADPIHNPAAQAAPTSPGSN